ncbi:Tim44 domain-containing protein [Mycoavidus sp. B2-EB]|uniref:Tim44 domain-containing protein n=1 Tax=Mycoavidus sp. B2-EB TaxID=2651972 RepID=UPI00351C4519
MLAGALAVGLTLQEAEAKRLGGGRSSGRQAQMFKQRQQAAPSPRPSQSNAAAQPTRNRWLGPLAGIAAGLGIGALLSHLGLGGAFGAMLSNLIIIGGIALLGYGLVRWFAARRVRHGVAAAPAFMRGAHESAMAANTGSNFDMRAGFAQEPRSMAAQFSGGMASAHTAVQPVNAVPAHFDTTLFLRNAKVLFVRLQAAWDAGDAADIREFTTPAMFAEIKLDLAERGTMLNQTEVVQLEAVLIGVEEQANETVASVQFSGLIREEQGTRAQPFSEKWNLTKRMQGHEGWLLAGIEQDTALSGAPLLS